MNTAAFVITLERAIERRQQVERIVGTCPWDCAISPAVDGSKLDPLYIADNLRRHLHHPHYPHELKMGEIGCFMSHRNLWQQMVDERIDLALILEDDVELHLPDFAETLNVAVECIQPGDYFEFQVRDLGDLHPVVREVGRWRIIQPRIVPLRTSAQLVTRLAAERLLKLSRRIDRPVDAFLQLTWITGVPIKVVVPSHVTEVSQQIGGSTISGKRKPILTRVRREILRPWYRSQIALMSYFTTRKRAG